MTNHVINPGDKVKDLVSGYTGIATSVTRFLNGCDRVCVCPPVKEDGSFQDERWFDATQCEIVQAAAIQPNPAVSVEKEPLRAVRPGGGSDHAAPSKAR